MNLSIEGHIARIVLERPEQHNAIEAQDVARLHAHLATVRAQKDVRVLVLTGTGTTFCAGASLPKIESGEMTGELFEALADDLATVRVPTIELAERLAGLAPLAVQGMKRILRDVAAGTMDEAAARALIEACASSRDFREGVRARREGCTPRFQGR